MTAVVPVAKVLVSYWYYKDVDLDEMCEAFPGTVLLFGDSGGFSAYTQGVSISVNDYAAWVRRWSHRLTNYANLDAIRDVDATAANQRALEAMGLAPLPVFHAGSPMAELEPLLDAYPYVALGGLVGGPADPTMRFAAECFRRAKRTGTVFHGFGLTRHKLLVSLPWFSVDSSSWGGGHRFGRVPLWDERTHKFVAVSVGDPQSVFRYGRLIRQHGVDPNDLADRTRYHQRHAIAVAAVAWQKYEQSIRLVHGPVELPNSSAGLHLYLAEGSSANILNMASGLHLYLAGAPSTTKLCLDGIATSEYLQTGTRRVKT